MTQRQPSGRWKGIQYDYDALLALDPNNSCLYCLSDRDVQIILAALEFAGWKTRYFTTSGATIDQATINGWKGHLGAALMSCLSIRQDPENPCLLQQENDDGTWTTWANLLLCPPHLVNIGGSIGVELPDNSIVTTDGETTYDGRSVPYTPPARGGTSDEAICLASANAENVIYQMHAQVFSRVFVPDATWAALVLVAVIVGLLALTVALAIIVSVIIAGGGVAILSGVSLADYTDTVRSQLKCILVEHATNTAGVVTFDYSAVKSAVEAKISGINIWAAIDLYLGVIGESGLNRAGATTAITEADCDGCTECEFGTDWCKVIITDHVNNDGTFAPDPADDTWTGTWGAFVLDMSGNYKWYASNMSRSGGIEQVVGWQLLATFPTGTYTDITFDYTINFGSFSVDIREFTIELNGTTIVSETTDNTVAHFHWNGSITGTLAFKLTAICSYRNDGTSGGGGASFGNLTLAGSGIEPAF